MWVLAGDGKKVIASPAGENPFTPKAHLFRYWNKHISNNLPKPQFLLNKASPLTAVELAKYTKLASDKSLSDHLSSFCSSANLFCFPDVFSNLEKHVRDANFVTYENKSFTNYGTRRHGGADSFKNYTSADSVPNNSFRLYSRGSAHHKDRFSTYGIDGALVDENFKSYGTAATAGSGDFKKYSSSSNFIDSLTFSSYSDAAKRRSQSFSTYADSSNVLENGMFKSYGKNGDANTNQFASYITESNSVASNFTNYGESGIRANDTFTNYGTNASIPQINFTSYGAGGNLAVDTFKNYKVGTFLAQDIFKSYDKKSNASKVGFINYQNNFFAIPDNFSSYGDGAKNLNITFKTYVADHNFMSYAKKGISFVEYIRQNSAELKAMEASGKVAKMWVEPGRFFREKMLKTGSVMPMPDIRDKMPKRSFLPKTIVSKLPSSMSRLSELKHIFHASDGSGMASILADALRECERAPSPGETKRCVGSIEDMIDFATSVLGKNVVVRSTENTHGSKKNILIGSVKGINGGKVTKSVSCHQSLYPYLLYYCHSVPKVRVYEADILDPTSKAKINHGVAICHIDTSAWSPTHGAFIALGSSPGKIEVCHWIFENDMTWTIAD